MITKYEPEDIRNAHAAVKRIMVDDNAVLVDVSARLLLKCHTNGCPLDLARMAQHENEFDIAHDVFGIARHMDRQTGELNNHFLPRFAL